MGYYKILGLEKEPFSTSPDPDFFYPSFSHETALKRLEISVRLKRGLNLILGDVGIGKTTILRMLLRAFSSGSEFDFHLIMDPSFKSEYQFLSRLVKIFDLSPQSKSTLDLKECIEHYLFTKTVEENRTVVLLIDEGQKLSFENIEALRMLLNFETNQYKLLQIVIMSQLDILPRLKRVRNFTDRIALKYTLNPLDAQETRNLINFRLKAAGYDNKKDLFSEDAIKQIYLKSHGYPRRISLICHDALEAAVISERRTIDSSLITEMPYEPITL
ncbi:MAG: AAA family ATPase [Candidatus Omnitrophica bacterium]|nr:AAA family ATPase [Candidatus Omnitrophota bacterium]